MRFSRIGWMSTVAFALAIAVPSSRAEASCVAPPPKLIWSYPANGATVPTNAVFWGIVPLGSRLRALLDGVELSGPPVVINGARFEPGALEPGEHQLEFIVEARGVPVLVPVSFTVADGPAAPSGGEVRLADYELHPKDAPLPSLCREVLASHDCYDTGQDAQLELETEVVPLLWIVGSGSDPNELQGAELWPGECGAPRLVIHSGRSACFSALAIDETGAERPANEVCSNGCGCSAGSGAFLLPVWLLALARRGRSRRPSPVQS